MKPADRLRSLRTFYGDFSESVSASAAAASEEGLRRYSTSDKGHEFVSIKIRSVPLKGTSQRVLSGRESSTPVNIYVAANSAGILPPASGSLMKKFWDNARTGIGYDPPWSTGPQFFAGTQNYVSQSDLNYLFSKVRTGKPTLDIGESLVELIRQNPVTMISDLLQSWARFSASTGIKNLRPSEFFKFEKNSGVPNLDSMRAQAASAVRGAKGSSKEAGKEFLLVQFGLMPLINDTIKVIEHLTLIHSKVYAGESKRIRTASALQKERFTVPTGNFSWNGPITNQPNQTGFTLGIGGSLGEIYVDRSWDTRLSGRIGGLARPNSTHRSFLDRADALMYNLGLQEPDLLWDLTSFSWLLDWWLHLGTSITNAHAYGLGGGERVDYAYATTAVNAVAYQRSSGRTFANSSYRTLVPMGTSKTEWKMKFRRRATPFGFGGDLSSLSSGQMNTLVALGLAKTR